MGCLYMCVCTCVHLCLKFLKVCFILVEIVFQESSRCFVPLSVLSLVRAVAEHSESHCGSQAKEKSRCTEKIHLAVTELHLCVASMARNHDAGDTSKVLQCSSKVSQAPSF